eukprot:evm.model.scf_55.8 EVM.evm.TU.scf_55.8   scf_55:147805-154361(-)
MDTRVLDKMAIAIEVVESSDRPPANCGCRRLVGSSKVSDAAVVLLLCVAVSLSIAPLLGRSDGWGYWRKEHLMLHQSPYVGLLKLAIMKNEHSKVDPAKVDELDRYLPKVPFSLVVTQGWQNSFVRIWVHTDEESKLSKFYQSVALSLVHESQKSNLIDVFEKGQTSLYTYYEDEKVAGRFMGAVIVIVCGVSTTLAAAVLFVWFMKGIDVQLVGWLARSWIAAFLMYFASVLEYTVLCIGAHREMKTGPLLEKGYLTRPGWAFWVTVGAATCWLMVAALVHMYKHHFMVEFTPKPESDVMSASDYKKKAVRRAITAKSSWNIPVNYDVTEAEYADGAA